MIYDFNSGHIHHPPIKPVHAPLYVIIVISNPIRFNSRYRLYREFERYVIDSGAIPYTVELAFGERGFEITDKHNPNHIQVSTHSELWHKENLINIGISRLPFDWEYVAWIDADVRFARPDWVSETVHQLQCYMFLQMFSQAQDLTPNHGPIGSMHNGFVYSYLNDINLDRPGYHVWHPGFAWAARREAVDHVGGLIDWAILGSGDRHMALAMVGKVETSFYPDLNQHYTQWCLEWEARCERFIQRDIGYMDGLLLHFWHGKKKNRQYDTRWKILVNNDFDPIYDLKKDWQGVWNLTDRNWKLRDDIRRYFRHRNEDGTEV